AGAQREAQYHQQSQGVKQLPFHIFYSFISVTRQVVAAQTVCLRNVVDLLSLSLPGPAYAGSWGMAGVRLEGLGEALRAPPVWWHQIYAFALRATVHPHLSARLLTCHGPAIACQVECHGPAAGANTSPRPPA